VEVLTPQTLGEALRLKAQRPDALPVQGGTDVMVEVNFDRLRPVALLNLNEVAELRGWSQGDGELRLGAGLTFAEVLEPALAALLPALAEAARTVGGPQIRNRGTIGGNLGTASPAGDALPPLLVADAEVVVASVRDERRVPLEEFLVGPRRNVLAADELVVGVVVDVAAGRETFLKVGPRNAMVIAIASLAVVVDREREQVRASFGSCGPVAGLVACPLEQKDTLSDRLVAAASPIDDVRGTAAYRRHALGVLARRALERCLA
jgi:CO/xanthine dehydrogenase FAD-binding subunit